MNIRKRKEEIFIECGFPGSLKGSGLLEYYGTKRKESLEGQDYYVVGALSSHQNWTGKDDPTKQRYKDKWNEMVVRTSKGKRLLKKYRLSEDFDNNNYTADSDDDESNEEAAGPVESDRRVPPILNKFPPALQKCWLQLIELQRRVNLEVVEPAVNQFVQRNDGIVDDDEENEYDRLLEYNFYEGDIENIAPEHRDLRVAIDTNIATTKWAIEEYLDTICHMMMTTKEDLPHNQNVSACVCM